MQLPTKNHLPGGHHGSLIVLDEIGREQDFHHGDGSNTSNRPSSHNGSLVLIRIVEVQMILLHFKFQASSRQPEPLCLADGGSLENESPGSPREERFQLKVLVLSVVAVKMETMFVRVCRGFCGTGRLFCKPNIARIENHERDASTV